MKNTQKRMCVLLVVAFTTLSQIFFVPNPIDLGIPAAWLFKPYNASPPAEDAPEYELGLDTKDAWAAQRDCKQPKPVDTVFLIYSAPWAWKSRAVLRLTLLSPWARNVFSWTGIFLLGLMEGHTAGEEVTDLWTQLEADALGDLVRLPLKDGYPSMVSKFLAGLRWARRHCPSVRYVIKIDDDMMVEATVLRRYLDTAVDPGARGLHCSITDSAKVRRNNTNPRFILSKELFPGTHYFRYCSGRVVVMNSPTAEALLRASRLVPPYPVDDAYVTGDLALAAGVPHKNLDFYDVVYGNAAPDVIFDRGFMLAHLETPLELTTLRLGGWYLSLWNDTLHRGMWGDTDHGADDNLQHAVYLLFRNRSGLLDVADALGYHDEAPTFVFERVPQAALRRFLFFFV